MPHLITKVSEHAVLINDEGHILLLQNIHSKDGSGIRTVTQNYILPGGRLDEGGQPVVCLLREIKEETGLTNVKVHLPVHTSYWEGSNPRYSVIYLARVYGPTPIVLQPEEAASFKWASWEEALATSVIHPEIHTALAKAQKLWSLKEIQNLA